MKHIGIDTSGINPVVEELLESTASTGRPMPRRERRVEAVVGASFVAAAAALWLVATPARVPVSALLVLVVAYAVSSRVHFEKGAGYTVPTQLVFVPMLVLLPPALVPPAVAVAISLGNLPDYLRGRTHPDRTTLVLGDSWHAVTPALLLAVAGPAEASWAAWPVYAAAVAAQFVTDYVVTTLREWLAIGVAPALQPRLLAWVYVVDTLLTPVGLLAALAAPADAVAALLCLPLVALLSIFARERTDGLQHALDLSRAYRGTALLMGEMLEADDPYTGGEHSHGVVALALEVGRRMGLDEREQRNLEFGALLHDIGKLKVPAEILNKPGKLTPDEWEVIKRHPEDGQRMLDRVGGVLAEVGLTVRAHHERWDGGGYPDGLVGRAIPLNARIICACDAFSAMTTNRSYRAAMDPADALVELRACAGTQFDASVVEAIGASVAVTTPPRLAETLAV